MTSFDVPTIVATPHEVAARDREVIARADIVGVKFVDNGPGYVPGDLAGFPRAEAQRFVDMGIASFDLHARLKIDAPPAVMEKANHALTAAAMGDIGLTFLREWEGYSDGQSAGFSEGLARSLIAAGVAIPHVRTAAPRRTLADIRASLAGR